MAAQRPNYRLRRGTARRQAAAATAPYGRPQYPATAARALGSVRASTKAGARTLPAHVARLLPAAPQQSVRIAPRWAGSGAPHWHNGAVTKRRVAAAAQPALDLAAIRRRGMYGY